jgi:hypothetical protein
MSLIVGGLSLTPILSAYDGQEGGLIGKRYAGADLSYQYYHSSRYDNSLDGALLVNNPVAPNVDAIFSYGLSHLMGPNYSRVRNQLSASVLTYAQDEYGKPFFTATLGEAWDTAKSYGAQLSDNSTFWGLGAGIEVGFMGNSAMTYTLSYTDGFRGSMLNPTWKYGLQLSHWFKPRVAGVASFTYNQISHAPDALQYTVGVRFLF